MLDEQMITVLVLISIHDNPWNSKVNNDELVRFTTRIKALFFIISNCHVHNQLMVPQIIDSVLLDREENRNRFVTGNYPPAHKIELRIP